MAEQRSDRRSDRNEGDPREELRPELRRVVEGIVRQVPAEDLVERALDKARRRVEIERERTLADKQPVAPEPEKAPADKQPMALKRRRVFWPLAAAASIGAVMIAGLLRVPPSVDPNLPKPMVLPQPQVAAAGDLPSAWAYHQALGQSPEALEALLDRHAKQMLQPEPQSFQASPFFRSSQPML